MLLFNAVSVVAVLPTIFLNVYLICFGRFVLGIIGGGMAVTLPRLIEETIPDYLLGKFGFITGLAQQFGSMLGIVLGLALPSSKDPAVLVDNQLWKVLFSLPWLFQLIQVLAFVTLFKEDTIKFLLL